MAVCAAYGIRHSEFLGWDKDDRDKAIWFHLDQQQTCPSCGTRRDEWDPEQGGNPRAYVAKTEQCPGCQALGQHRNGLGKEIERLHGVQIVLKPNPDLRG